MNRRLLTLSFFCFSQIASAESFRVNDDTDNAKKIFQLLAETPVVKVVMTDSQAHARIKALIKDKKELIANGSTIIETVKVETITQGIVSCKKTTKLGVGENYAIVSKFKQDKSQDEITVVSGLWSTSVNGYLADFYSCTFNS